MYEIYLPYNPPNSGISHSRKTCLKSLAPKAFTRPEYNGIHIRP